jgi:hypothetical protein
MGGDCDRQPLEMRDNIECSFARRSIDSRRRSLTILWRVLYTLLRHYCAAAVVAALNLVGSCGRVFKTAIKAIGLNVHASELLCIALCGDFSSK